MADLIDDLHSKITKILGKFHQFCLDNNLTYYMLGGTQFGAVRHQGFIPWDDDADLGMPREDYNKLIELKDQLEGIDLRIGEKDGFDYMFIKAYNPNTTVVEEISSKISVIGGANIDIFPLDGAGNTEKIAKKMYSKKRFWHALYLRKFVDYPKDNKLKFLLWQFFKMIYVPRKTIVKNLNKIFNKYKFYESEYVINYMGMWGIREMLPREIFGKPQLYKFEDIELYGVEHPDKYLRTLYGNYMELPPVEKRHTHPFPYINLELPYKEYIANKEGK